MEEIERDINCMSATMLLLAKQNTTKSMYHEIVSPCNVRLTKYKELLWPSAVAVRLTHVFMEVSLTARLAKCG